MKTKRPSRTAHLVALGRAMADAGLSHVPDFRDPTARVFLNDKGKQSLAKIELWIFVPDGSNFFTPGIGNRVTRISR